VIAVRQAFRHKQRALREVAVGSIESAENDALLTQLTTPRDPAADQLKGHYRNEFKRAFEAALRALGARDRTGLRQYYVDAVTPHEIGNLYRVHRSTAARFVVRARQRLFESTRAR